MVSARLRCATLSATLFPFPHIFAPNWGQWFVGRHRAGSMVPIGFGCARQGQSEDFNMVDGQVLDPNEDHVSVNGWQLLSERSEL